MSFHSTPLEIIDGKGRLSEHKFQLKNECGNMT